MRTPCAFSTPENASEVNCAPWFGIEDLWRAVAGNSFLHRFDVECGAPRVREPVDQHLATAPVDHGCEIEKAFRHGDIRNVRRVDFAGSRHLHTSEQIGIYLVFFARRRRAALRVDSPQAHKANDAAYGYTNASHPEPALYRARSARGTLHVEAVDLFHDGKVLFALFPRTVVGRRTAQFDQFALANYGQCALSWRGARLTVATERLFHDCIWFGCTSKRSASSASVLSPHTAARTTFALNEGLWVLRVRLDMDSFRVGYVGTRSQHYTLNSAQICPINPNHLSVGESVVKRLIGYPLLK